MSSSPISAAPDDGGQEPTDDELISISREAFAGVADANRRALAGVYDRIEIERARILARVQGRTAVRRGSSGLAG